MEFGGRGAALMQRDLAGVKVVTRKREATGAEARVEEGKPPGEMKAARMAGFETA